MTKDEKIAIRQELAALEDRNGCVTPDTVVAAAEDPQSPLHEHFDWDDTSAARKFRTEQARTLIRSVPTVVVTDEFIGGAAIPVYVRDVTVDPTDQGYRRLDRIRDDHEVAQRTVSRELAYANAAMSRANRIAESLSISGDVTHASEVVARVATKAAELAQSTQ